MNANRVVNNLLENDADTERYVQGIVPSEPSLWDLDNALHSRGFQFWEYDPQMKVKVNRWVYEQGDDFWVVNPSVEPYPEAWFNIQHWVGSKLVDSYTSDLRKIVRYFDKNRRT